MGDIRLTSWGNSFTVQSGAKRPSNVEITCHQNLSLRKLFLINVKKKGRFFLFISRDSRKSLRQDSSRSHKNTFDTPSWRASMGWLGRLYRFFPKQKQLELFNTQFVVRPLKLVFMLNFSQISEVKWPRLFLKISKVTDHWSWAWMTDRSRIVQPFSGWKIRKIPLFSLASESHKLIINHLS